MDIRFTALLLTAFCWFLLLPLAAILGSLATTYLFADNHLPFAAISFAPAQPIT